MAGQSTRRARRQKYTLSLNAPISAGWTAPVKLDKLGWSGLLARGVIRGAAVFPGQLTLAEIKIWYGEGYDETTIPTTVPDEDVAWHETTIVIDGDPIVADLDKDLLALHNGAMFDVRGEDEELWMSFNTGTTAVAQNIVLSIEAVDTL